jgi:hypothetical protein
MLEDTSSCPITCTCFALRIPTPRHYRILSEHGNVGAVGEFPKCRGQRPRLQARFGSGNFSIISCVPKKATTKNGTMFAIIQSGPTWRKAPPNGHSLEKLRRFVSNNLCNSRECRPRVAGFARLIKFGKRPRPATAATSASRKISAPRHHARAQGPGRSRLQRVLSTRLCAKA